MPTDSLTSMTPAAPAAPAPAVPVVPLTVEVERAADAPGYLKLTVTLAPKLKAALQQAISTARDGGRLMDHTPVVPGFTATTARTREFRHVLLPGMPSTSNVVVGVLVGLLQWTGWCDIPDGFNTATICWRCSQAQVDRTKREMDQAMTQLRHWIQSTLLAWKITFAIQADGI